MTETILNDEIEKSNSDEIPPEVLKARQEWDNIGQQQELLNELPKEVGVGGVIIDRGYPITFFDSRAYLIEQANDQISAQLPDIPLIPRKFCCFPKRCPPNYIEAYKAILKISKLAFIENDLTHHRILNTLHSKITGCVSSPPRKSPQWENVGFQSQDPIIDLRGTGMLGLLIPLGFFVQYPELASRIYEISRTKNHEFPLMLILINFISAVLDSIKNSSTILNTGTSFDDSWNQMMSIFGGMIKKVSEVWLEEEMDYEHNFLFFHDIMKDVKRNPLHFSLRPPK